MKKFLKYFLVFIPAMLLLILLNKHLEFIDYFVYEKVYLNNAKSSQIDENIILIDLPRVAEGKELEDINNFRLRLADLIINLKEKIDVGTVPPKAVIIDFYFTNVQSQEEALNQLKFAITILRRTNTKVFATYNLNDYEKKNFEDVENKSVKELYSDSLNYFQDGRLHTQIVNKYGVLNYKANLQFKDNLPTAGIMALPLKVAENEESTANGFVLPIGDPSSLNRQTFKFIHEKNQTINGELMIPDNIKSTPNYWYEKYIIIGDLERDKKDSFEGHSGPQLLAWALNDQLKSEDSKFAKQPFNNFAGILALAFFLSLIVIGIFFIVFKLIIKLQRKPLIIALISSLLGLIILILIGIAIVNINNQVLPVFYISSSMLMTSGFAWHYCKQIVIPANVEGTGEYDVFISYNRKSSGDWVLKNVYEPLKNYEKEKGKTINIFFDKDSIKNGNGFAFKYTEGVQDSKIFVPIFSDGYKTSGHCMNELAVAYTRFAGTPRKIELFLITYSDENVPRQVTHIDYQHKDDDFLNDLIERIEGLEKKS